MRYETVVVNGRVVMNAFLDDEVVASVERDDEDGFNINVKAELEDNDMTNIFKEAKERL